MFLCLFCPCQGIQRNNFGPLCFFAHNVSLLRKKNPKELCNTFLRVQKEKRETFHMLGTAGPLSMEKAFSLKNPDVADLRHSKRTLFSLFITKKTFGEVFYAPSTTILRESFMGCMVSSGKGWACRQVFTEVPHILMNPTEAPWSKESASV